jgi:hypothetical protein
VFNEVGLDHAPEVLEREVGDRTAMLDAGVGHQDVEPAVSLDGACDRRRAGGRVGDVEDGGLGLAACRLDLGHAGLDRRRVARVEHHPRAVARQALGHRPAEPARCAGDQCDLAVESEHDAVSSLGRRKDTGRPHHERGSALSSTRRRFSTAT